MFNIIRNPRGYYTLYQDGIFEGNYDSQGEAAQAADRLMHGGDGAEEAVRTSGEGYLKSASCC